MGTLSVAWRPIPDARLLTPDSAIAAYGGGQSLLVVQQDRLLFRESGNSTGTTARFRQARLSGMAWLGLERETRLELPQDPDERVGPI